MHELFKSVAGEALPNPYVHTVRDIGGVNTLEYGLKCGNTKPTTVFAKTVKNKLESIDKGFCEKFFSVFKTERILRDFQERIDPDCWPKWFADK